MLRVSVHRSALQAVLQILLRWFPFPLRSCIHSAFPEWFVPTKIVVKKQKEGWEEEFDMEKAYEKL